MPLPYGVNRVLSFFLRRVEAYDLVMQDGNGFEAEPHRTPRYSFSGVLIPPTDKDLQLFDEGEIASGAMTLYVNKDVKLHCNDAVDPGEVSRQTIVCFDGDEYRVKGYSNRSADGLHRKYTMVRYMPRRA